MLCTVCHSDVSPDTDGLALKHLFGLELTRSEQETLNRLNAEETVCISCKREMLFAGLLLVV